MFWIDRSDSFWLWLKLAYTLRLIQWYVTQNTQWYSAFMVFWFDLSSLMFLCGRSGYWKWPVFCWLLHRSSLPKLYNCILLLSCTNHAISNRENIHKSIFILFNPTVSSRPLIWMVEQTFHCVYYPFVKSHFLVRISYCNGISDIISGLGK